MSILKGLCFALLFLALSPVSSAELPAYYDGSFDDLEGVEYSKAILWTLNNGITQGYNESEWKPNQCITRAQIVKMMIEYRYEDILDNSYNYAKTFSDVNSDDWFFDYIAIASMNGIVEGYPDGTFKPNNCVNRVEAMKVAMETLIYDDLIDNLSTPLSYDDKQIADMSGSEWYSDYARTMFELRLVGTNHTRFLDDKPSLVKQINFFPAEDMSRKEVAKMMYEIDNFISNQMRNGYVYENTDYGFEVNIPSTWGEKNVINEITIDDEAIVDQFQIVSQDGDKSLRLYVIDRSLVDSSLIFDLPINYFGGNNKYDLYLSWNPILGSTPNADALRKMQNSDIFKIESSIELFDI
jgi:hypothetical protein